MSLARVVCLNRLAYPSLLPEPYALEPPIRAVSLSLTRLSERVTWTGS